MLSNQARELSAAGASMRQQVHGTRADGSLVTLEYDNGAQTPAGYFTIIRSQEQLDTLGFKLAHDAAVRCLKIALIAPQLNKTFNLPMPDGSKLLVRIDEFANNELNPEWVLGCKALY